MESEGVRIEFRGAGEDGAIVFSKSAVVGDRDCVIAAITELLESHFPQGK